MYYKMNECWMSAINSKIAYFITEAEWDSNIGVFLCFSGGKAETVTDNLLLDW